MPPTPTDASIRKGAAAFAAHRADAVVALGGGSGLDAGKAIAMVARSGVALEEFEWTRPPPEVAPGDLPPVITVPTTAGTGAEVTRYAVVTDSESGEKMLCAGAAFVPAACVVGGSA